MNVSFPQYRRFGYCLAFFVFLATFALAQIAPGFYNLPVGVTVNYGQTLSISATVTGTSPVTYQWAKDGVGISGATSTSYYKSDVTLADAGQYTLTATNGSGSVTSSAVTVTINPGVSPVFVNVPAGINVISGDTLSLYLSPVGTAPMTFQWKKDGVNIAGATSSSYYKSGISNTDAGQYTLTATNAFGTTTSSSIVVSVGAAIAPYITSRLPAIPPVASGDYLSFSVGVSGSMPMTYQWKKDGVAIAGATSYYFSKSPATTADSGQYTVTATNSAGSVTSDIIAVLVNPPVAPTITGVSSNQAVSTGGYLSLNASVIGTPSIAFQWKKDGVAIPFANQSYFSRSPVTSEDAGVYTLTATNSLGTVTSSSVTVTVIPPAPAQAPVISLMPATVLTAYGEYFSLVPLVTGSQPMTAQWKKDGVSIAGATSLSYSKTATSDDAGSYTLTVTNSTGTAVSTTAVVSVSAAVAPTVANLPSNLAINYGSSLYLSPTFSGSNPKAYQWFKDGVAIGGANNSSFSINSVSASNAGVYTVTVANQAGSVTSAGVTVAVNAAVSPTVSGLPVSVTLNYGDEINLGASVQGTSPFSYQWKKDGVTLFGATNSNFNKYRMTPADSGVYTLTVTNVAGSTTSAGVSVSVNAATVPVINGIPPAITVNSGEGLSINPVVTGTTPMSFEWKKGGVVQPGYVTSSFIKAGVTTADSGQYVLTATNQAGSTSSTAVTVTVNAAVAPVIVNLPSALTLAYGSNLNLSATVGGTQPMSLQWKKNGAVIPGANSSYFSLDYLTTADSAQYTLTATNAAGAVTSSIVTVTVSPAVAPTISGLPDAVTIVYGSYYYFSAYVSGTAPMTYQWKKDGVVVSNSFNFSISDAKPANSGQYTLTATNLVGTATSSTFALTVSPPVAPSISQDPISATVLLASSVRFDASATGSNPLSYQWYRDGNAIFGQTSSSLMIDSTKLTDAGSYKVVVSGPGGQATSATAVLTVASPQATTSIAAGGVHTLFIRPDGKLWGMGWNYAGTLGDASNSGHTVPQYLAATGINVVSIAAGSGHSMYLKADGSLWGMGDNSYGQMGDGTMGGWRTTPVQVITGIATVWAGGNQTVYLKTNGTLWGAGSNTSGQLGDGTYVNRSAPVMIDSDVASASVGSNHIVFVKADGTLWAIGGNSAGQLGDGSTTTRTTAVLVASNVASASAGGSHTLFIKRDGTLWATGGNSDGQLGDGTTVSKTSPVQIAANVESVSAGSSHTLFVKTDGTLWAMGNNSSGKLGDGTYTARFVPTQIDSGVLVARAGGEHSIYLKKDGSLYGMGQNYYGQISSQNLYSQIAAPVLITSGTTSVPSAPSGVVATDGTVSAAVRITWNPLINATGYEVWRSTGSSSGSAVKIASNVPFSLYYDNTVTTGTTYYYWVKAVNSAGSSAFSGSDTGYSSASTAPTIVSDPQSQVIVANGAVAFHTTVTGSPFPSVQWQKNGVDIAGATNLTLTIANVQLSDAGSYQAKATNVAGTAVSAAAILSVKALTEPDFNGDNKPDIIWQNRTTGQRLIWLMNGFSVSTGVGLGTVPPEWEIAATGDFNGDAKVDLVWENTQTGERTVWLMDGTTVSTSAGLGTIPLDWVIAATGDFNNDGKSDLVWQNTITGERSIWLMNGTSVASGIGLGTVPTEWWIAGTGDFNSDGQTDIYWQNTVTGQHLVWYMNGTTVTAGVGLNTYSQYSIAGIADYSGDGKPDLLMTDNNTGARSIWVLNGTSVTYNYYLTSLSLDWVLNRPIPRRTYADFNGDGKTDIVWQNSITGERMVWLMNGTSVASGVNLTTIPPEWRIATTGDFNNDGKADLVWQNTITGERSIWLMNGTTVSTSAGLGVTPVAWTICANGDFNFDGQTDLLVQNTNTNEAAIWFMSGTNRTSIYSLGVQASLRIAVVGDFNNDGQADIIWRNPTTGAHTVWLMYGTNKNSEVPIGTFGPEWAITGSGDFNQDGKSDLIWQNSATGERLLWLMDGTSVSTGFGLGTFPTEWSFGD